MWATEPLNYNQFIVKNFGPDVIIGDYAGDYVQRSEINHIYKKLYWRT